MPVYSNTARWDAERRRKAARQTSLLEPKPSPQDEWQTPWTLIRELEYRFGAFELDPCCLASSAKAPAFYTPREDGLLQPWAPRLTFCNPPYSHIADWLRKARVEALAGSTVVCLIPARTEMGWWHDLVQPFAEVTFLRSKQDFLAAEGRRAQPVLASAVAVYRPGGHRGPS